MNTVHRDISVTTAEGNVNDDQIVDVLHVGADLRFGQAAVLSRVNQEIASSSTGSLVGDVLIQMILALGPPDFDLTELSMGVTFEDELTNPLGMEVDVITFCPCQKLGGTIEESHRGAPLTAHVHAQDPAAFDHGKQIS